MLYIVKKVFIFIHNLNGYIQVLCKYVYLMLIFQISENFYFDVNQDDMKKMIVMHIQHADVSTMSRAACFSITYPSPDVFLVIRVEHLLICSPIIRTQIIILMLYEKFEWLVYTELHSKWLFDSSYS